MHRVSPKSAYEAVPRSSSATWTALAGTSHLNTAHCYVAQSTPLLLLLEWCTISNDLLCTQTRIQSPSHSSSSLTVGISGSLALCPFRPEADDGTTIGTETTTNIHLRQQQQCYGHSVLALVSREEALAVITFNVPHIYYECLALLHNLNRPGCLLILN